MSSFWGLGQCEDVLNYNSVLETLEDFLGGLNRTGYRMTWGEPLSSRSGDHTYQVSRGLLMEEIFDRDNLWEVEQYLECAVRADVDTGRRTLANVEVVQGKIVQDGVTRNSYPR